ncbi:MAG: pyruvate formate lyase-activating protein [Clostridia bacterium]|nr:pyruvate formate lyase-activating protein [Clostridia bacterium]
MELEKNKIARIHSVESFGTVDGPGIRYVLFLQGCPLKCKYCHNRDTWDTFLGTTRTLDELLSEIKRYTAYFNSSHGGVTVSGGEPLLQAEFVTELFKELHKLNIHTAIDTAGSLPLNDTIKELLAYTDLVLLDIKHINEEKSKELTGLSNKNNLAFAKYLNEKNIPVWIRQVLVPGYTDAPEDLKELKKFIDSLSNVKKVELLPYHKLGEFKWKNFGEEFPLKDVLPPTKEEIDKAKAILEI